jgi:DNA adenine methylase
MVVVSILLAKKPVEIEVYNDLDSGLFDFFSVIADPKLFEQFYRRVQASPVSRELYYHCRTSWENEIEVVERVARWFVVARQSFSGHFAHSWSFVVTKSTRGMSDTTSKWLSCIDKLPEVHSRLVRLQIEHNDWRQVLSTYDTLDTLFYLDPPYVPGKRSSGKYKHEMTEDDHREMIDQIQELDGHVALSGYQNDIYDVLTTRGWKRHDWATACHAAGRTQGSGILGKGAAMQMQSRTECLWVKPYSTGQLKMFR